jgi:hypothetical protein
MVCLAELVLDDEDCVVGEISADEIQDVATYGMLSSLEFEVDSERVGEMLGVLQQPRRKVASLIGQIARGSTGSSLPSSRDTFEA